MATSPVGERIGKGSFGEVFLYKDPTTGQMMVDKHLLVEDLMDDELDAVENEIQIMQRLKHPHIVILKGYMKTDSILHIYMEYMQGRDLAKLITEYRKKKQTFGETIIIKYMSQLLSAVAYIHKKKLIHRDLKPANILLSEDKQRLKVTDFGVSTACESLASKHQTTIGTVAYMAPEVVEGKPYKYKCDVWSLGVIAYELVELKLPVQVMNMAAMLLKIAKGEIEPMSSKGRAALRELIMSMLKKGSDLRPECSVLLQNRLFEDIPDISALRIKEPTLAEVWQAAYDGELPRLRQLLEDSSNDGVLIDGLHETDTWMKRTTPTMAAAGGGHKHVVKWIISNKKTKVDKRGVIVSSDGGRLIGGMTALLIACRQGHRSVVDTLINDGKASVDVVHDEGATCLLQAALGGNCSLIKDLIGRGNRVEDRDKNGWTALLFAAQGGKADAVELLISVGAEINAVNAAGRTCLIEAAYGGNCDVITSLIGRGCRVADRDNNGSTALHYAAGMGKAEAIELLITEGAEVDVKDILKYTPLHYAASNGHVEALRVLLNNGGNINVREFQKRTLLHLSAKNGHTAAISFLLAAGCDITATDRNGETPKALAEYFNHPEAAHLLDG